MGSDSEKPRTAAAPTSSLRGALQLLALVGVLMLLMRNLAAMGPAKPASVADVHRAAFDELKQSAPITVEGGRADAHEQPVQLQAPGASAEAAPATAAMAAAAAATAGPAAAVVTPAAAVATTAADGGPKGMSDAAVAAVSKRLASVPEAKASGRVSPQCRLSVDRERRALLRFVPSAVGAPGCGGRLPAALCAAVRGALRDAPPTGAEQPRLLVTTFAASQLDLLRQFADGAAALRVPLVALAMDAEGEAAAAAATGGGVCMVAQAPPISGVDGGGTPLARKWAALGLLAEAGVAALYIDVDGVLAAAPFPSVGAATLHFDSDVEALSEALEEDDARVRRGEAARTLSHSQISSCLLPQVAPRR